MTAITTATPGVIAVAGSPVYAADPDHTHGGDWMASSGSGGTWAYAFDNRLVAGADVYGSITFPVSGHESFVKVQDPLSVDVFSLRSNPEGKIAMYDAISGGAALDKAEVVATEGALIRYAVVATWDPAANVMTLVARIFYGQFVETENYQSELVAETPCTTGIGRILFGNIGGNIVANVKDWRQDNDGTWLPPVAPETALVHEFSWAGVPGTTSVVISSTVVGPTTCDLAYSTNSDMSSPSFAGSQSVDPDTNVVKHSLSALTAGTQYYYQPYDGALFGTVCMFKTCVSNPATAVDLSVVWTSCQAKSRSGNLDPEQPSWVKMLALNPDLIMHQGDFHYNGGAFEGGETIADHFKFYRLQMTGLDKMRLVMMRGGCLIQLSDHETSANNGQNWQFYNPVGDPKNKEQVPWAEVTETALRMYEACMPVAPAEFGDQRSPRHGRYFSKKLSPNILLISIDLRSWDRTLSSANDGPSKDMLGGPQWTWLAAELRRPEVLKIISSDDAWPCQASEADFLAYVDPDPITGGDATAYNNEQPFIEKWWSYFTSQKQLAAIICNPTTGVHNLTTIGTPINVLFMGGDRHFVGYLSEANNILWDGTKCGFPCWTTSGSDRNGLPLVLGEIYDLVDGNLPLGTHPGGFTTEVRHFVHTRIQDNGTNLITVTGTPWRCADPTLGPNQGYTAVNSFTPPSPLTWSY